MVGHGQAPLFKVFLPRRAADNPALPDGAPSKVASRASERWLAVLGGIDNGEIRPIPQRALSFAHDLFGKPLHTFPDHAR